MTRDRRRTAPLTTAAVATTAATVPSVLCTVKLGRATAKIRAETPSSKKRVDNRVRCGSSTLVVEQGFE